MALDGNTVKTYLLQSIHPNRETRRVATEKLLSFQTDPNSNFCQLLLKIIQGQQEHGTGGNEATAQHAAAIYFKNYVKKGWDSVSTWKTLCRVRFCCESTEEHHICICVE